MENDLKKEMYAYNNLVHKSAKKTQNEAFYSQSQSLYDEVKSNWLYKKF